jgi:Sap, sulfolipid-1-addressing protein
MPSEALSLALAASIYPPAVAAIIALGRGTDVRLRVVLMVLAALLTVFVTGSLLLLLLNDLGATSDTQLTVSAWLYLAGGLALVVLAVWLRRRPPKETPKQPSGGSKTERYLESRRLVLLLGVILYVVPSPIYLGAVKAIADAKVSTPTQLVYLAVVALVMLWMIELPMLVLLAFPRGGSSALESVNDWFVRNGRLVAVIAAAGAGLYLIGVGLVELIG